jgi:UDP-N-acetylmuramyl pentapeptide phosphotransferase/UDP-N-acetylglucosamine-1-phosphate transferase
LQKLFFKKGILKMPHAFIISMVGLVVWLVLLPALLFFLLTRIHLIRPNFRGRKIPTAFGLILPLWGIAAFLCLQPYIHEWRMNLPPWMITILGFAVIGFMDDALGDRKSTGLKGHVHVFIKSRRITTGLFKAISGILLALLISIFCFHHGWIDLLLNAILIALSANMINLLDLRPGRAGAISILFALALILYPLITCGAISPLMALLPPAMLLYILDSRAMVMMGDTGSNTLGASLGLAAAQTVSLYPKILIVLLVLLMHLLAEKYSFSAEIEKRPWLRFLDSLTGLR